MEYQEQEIRIDSSKLNFWGNPEDQKIYAGYGQPNHGFGESGQDFYPVYDMNVKADNKELMRTAKADDITKSPWMGEWYDRYQKWNELHSDPVTRMAAQTSGDHTAIEMVKRKILAARQGSEQGRPPVEARICPSVQDEKAKACPAVERCFGRKPATSFWDE